MKIAIFGFHDTFTGQILNFLPLKIKKQIKFLISTTPLPKKNDQSSFKRPNKNLEFIKKNKIFGKNIYYLKDYISFLKTKKITHCFVLVENITIRRKIFDNLNKNKIKILSFIHSSVKFAGKNKKGEGIIIFPDCYFGYKSEIHDGVIVEANSKIEHHTVINKFCNIYPNLNIAGQSLISKYCTIGLSVDIIDKINVAENCFIGAGSLVLKNTRKNSLYYGRPAKFVRYINK